MTNVGIGAVPMVELWRGERLESLHQGHAVICDASGAIVEAWGNPEALIYPRSSAKMIQALPLIESGAADGLTDKQIALACASHQGAAIHVDAVSKWLADMDLSEADLRCGTREPHDIEERNRLICTGDSACQIHNECSGKHTGFLMLNKHLGGGPDYIDPDHIVQRTFRQAFEDITGEESPGYGIDGCSAPNYATSITGLARAMSAFASAEETNARGKAMVKLRHAMATQPEMVAGETRACTELMRAMGGKVAIKTGAEAVFVAILPEQKLGIALKILDGGIRASEAAMTGLLARAGVLDPAHPAAQKRLGAPQKNCRGITFGETCLAPGFAQA